MTRVTLTIWDDGDEVKAEASMDNPNAINEPPTGALIIGSYLGGNFDLVARNAMHWFRHEIAKESQAQEPEIAEPRPKIILPNGDGSIQ